VEWNTETFRQRLGGDWQRNAKHVRPFEEVGTSEPIFLGGWPQSRTESSSASAKTVSPGFDSRQGNFLYCTAFRPSLGSSGYRRSLLEGAAAGAWSWLLTSCAEVKNGGSVPPLPHTSSRSGSSFWFHHRPTAFGCYEILQNCWVADEFAGLRVGVPYYFFLSFPFIFFSLVFSFLFLSFLLCSLLLFSFHFISFVFFCFFPFLFFSPLFYFPRWADLQRLQHLRLCKVEW
jgi:hypothetical protein